MPPRRWDRLRGALGASPRRSRTQFPRRLVQPVPDTIASLSKCCHASTRSLRSLRGNWRARSRGAHPAVFGRGAHPSRERRRSGGNPVRAIGRRRPSKTARRVRCERALDWMPHRLRLHSVPGWLHTRRGGQYRRRREHGVHHVCGKLPRGQREHVCGVRDGKRQ